ncbi:MAG: hypothetical protein ACJAW3_001161 [Lentimonas sp.]|jgi:hypothetical protein
MENPQTQHQFLKELILKFRQELQKMNQTIEFSESCDEELLEIMGQLVAIKEQIASLEIIYLEKCLDKESKKDYLKS